MNYAIVYHYWGETTNNLNNPILLSIATLRCHCQLPVYVIDCSTTPLNWEYYEQMLQFKAIHFTHILTPCPNKDIAYKLCSKPFDIEKIADTISENCIIFSDADIMWLKDPLPLIGSPNKFCCRSENTGVFYFDKNSLHVKKLFKTWKAITIDAMKSLKLRQVIWDFTFRPVRVLYDEIIYHYMICHTDVLYNDIPPAENFIVGRETMPENSKNAHFMRQYFFPNRGLMCLLIEELAKLTKQNSKILSLIDYRASPICCLSDIRCNRQKITEQLYKSVSHLML